MMIAKPIPEGNLTGTPYLTTSHVSGLIYFLQRAFKAKLTTQTDALDGNIIHAEVEIGSSKVMIGEGDDDYPPMPAMLYLYVDDIDDIYKRAIYSGGEKIQEPEDQFYGDRIASIRDPYGNLWGIATHIETSHPKRW